jgi:hypothetical protein
MRGAIGVLVLVALAVATGGCSGRKSNLLTERLSRGAIEEQPGVAKALAWEITPEEQLLTKSLVDVTIRYTPQEHLDNLFARKDLFGDFAGKKKNPFYREHMVFYAKIANRSQKKIHINPAEFVLVDDRGNQYSPIGVEYVTALTESKRPMSTTTRTVLQDASPGYMGFSFPVGRMVMGKAHQGESALMQQSLLQPGYLFPGVTYDGLVVFWSPPSDIKKLRLFVSNIKADFGADDLPGSSIDFPFEFSTLVR